MFNLNMANFHKQANVLLIDGISEHIASFTTNDCMEFGTMLS